MENHCYLFTVNQKYYLSTDIYHFENIVLLLL